MRTPDVRLEEVVNMVNFKLYHEADKKIDGIYEDFTKGRIQLDENQENLMFELIDKISRYLYG